MTSSEDTMWEPTYLFWSIAVYISTAAAGLAASLATPLVHGAASGWGLETLLSYLTSNGAQGVGLVLALAMAVLMLSVPPGLLSLYLMALSNLRLALHPVVGAVFFAIGVGWLLQSLPGAVFGLLFGGVSLGGTALMLGLRRGIDNRRAHVASDGTAA